MKFTPEHNAFVLHGLLSGFHRAYGYTPHAWDDLDEQPQVDFLLAVADVGITSELTLDEWFNKHWRLFPFGESHLKNLSEVHQEVVECVHEQITVGTFWYVSEFSPSTGNGDDDA